ncbi:Nn.00g062820.m01.CDS01 [Neocucurbitaria sp. VM-36]
MASKLCCTAEQDGRPGSPELPNARVSQATPAKRPLLPKETASPNSRFTSAQSADLHELHNIFNNAQDQVEDQASPTRIPRARFSRGSLYSLRSLHKMTSMRSIIRRKFSKDLPRSLVAPPTRSTVKNKVIGEEPTVVKQLIDGPNHQLNITKDDLKKHLLSDRKPDEGGYDPDAEMLDDIASNIGKKTPGKRPSIHSIDWMPFTSSKPTPGSSTEGRNSIELRRDLTPYQIQKPQTSSFSTRVAQVLSTPNLLTDTTSEKDRKSRRSHSASAMGLPRPSPISPLKLPSLTTYDKNGVSWSDAMNESLHLSQFPIPPRHISPNASETTSATNQDSKGSGNDDQSQESAPVVPPHRVSNSFAVLPARQRTSISSPRTSASVRGVLHENAPLNKEGGDEHDEDNSLRSVHLYSMRISHHLRSGSLLSWDQLTDASNFPEPARPFRERTVSDQSRYSHIRRQIARHERQTSSSGFASSKVPSKWGRVLLNDHELRADVASSVYSSRPQSPPDGLDGSLVEFSRSSTGHHTFSISSKDPKKHRRSNSFPNDKHEISRPAQPYDILKITRAQESTVEMALLNKPLPLARKNSVAETKVSKFREEFSPSPPKKKLTPSTSIIKFLNPKRLGIRSQSEANLQPDSASMPMDGPSDTAPISDNRERQHSRSMMSFQAEQEALGKNNGADHVWDRALVAHQQEKASLLLPKNRDLPVHASPFRERSGSIATRRTSIEEDADSAFHAANTIKSYSTLLLNPPSLGDLGSDLSLTGIPRRSALINSIDASPGREVSNAFEKQGDSPEVVGAWGRYPSHTRHDRIYSANQMERVDTRDFALETAIRLATAKSDGHGDSLIDPTERLPSPPLLPGEMKKKRKVGYGRMAKSNSMTFGRNFLKNYSKIFKSQSTEFRKHGRGHRSSIASGGILEFPELELLPDVWTGAVTGEGSAAPHNSSVEHAVQQSNHSNSDSKGKSKLQVEDSMATLRPRRNSSAPNLNELSFRDGAHDSDRTPDRARVWSIYYENCVPSFPRISNEANFGDDDFDRSARLSFDSKGSPMHSHSFPTRASRHSRNTSQLSRISVVSRGSARPSFISLKSDGAAEDQSLVSVRRSTMDLISKFKEQEIAEHERFMGLTKG